MADRKTYWQNFHALRMRDPSMTKTEAQVLMRAVDFSDSESLDEETLAYRLSSLREPEKREPEKREPEKREPKKRERNSLVDAIVEKIHRRKAKPVVLSFGNCTVTFVGPSTEVRELILKVLA
jgi:hypothetical protein